MTATAKDYLNRRVDILLWDGDVVVGRDTLTPPALATGGKIVTGVEKAAQAFLLRLLTPLGSIPGRLERGTILITRARQGAWRTSIDVAQDYLLAASDALRQLYDERQEGDPDDELIDSQSLDSVAISSGTVTLRISITTLAGTTRTYIQPIAVGIRG